MRVLPPRRAQAMHKQSQRVNTAEEGARQDKQRFLKRHCKWYSSAGGYCHTYRNVWNGNWITFTKRDSVFLLNDPQLREEMHQTHTEYTVGLLPELAVRLFSSFNWLLQTWITIFKICTWVHKFPRFSQKEYNIIPLAVLHLMLCGLVHSVLKLWIHCHRRMRNELYWAQQS